MEIRIEPALFDQRPVFAQLANLYNYDFSEYEHNDVDECGYFYGYYSDNLWAGDKRHHFFVRVNGKLAGFVIVKDGGFRYINDENACHICEFFIMKKYRRNGVGSIVAKTIFDMYKRNWEVCQMQNNIPARKFWKSVISDYTKNNYQECGTEKDDMVGFIFDNAHQ